MNGNAIMTIGLALDIAGIFMLWRQFNVKKWRKEDQENSLPDVLPEKNLYSYSLLDVKR